MNKRRKKTVKRASGKECGHALSIAIAATVLGMTMGIDLNEAMARPRQTDLPGKSGVTLGDTGAPGAEFPKVERPGVQFPKVERPGVQFPKVERPGAEFPKVERPGAEFPKVEVFNIQHSAGEGREGETEMPPHPLGR